MSLRTRLAIVLGVLLAVVGVTFLFSLSRVQDVREAGQVVVQQAQPAMTASNTVSREALSVQIETALFVFEPSNEQRAVVAEADAAVREQLALLNTIEIDDAATAAAVVEVENAYTTWTDTVIEPVLRAIENDDRDGARALSGSEESRATNEQLEVALADLQSAVVDWRARTVTQTSDAVNALQSGLVVALLAVLGAVAAVWIGLLRWVRRPLTSISEDLRTVASGDLEHRISIVGPPELADTSRDAEDMRQRLLREVDDAVAAREALDHRGPVVSAIRRELRSADIPAVGSLDVHGLLIPAEGVLAGDWFDAMELPDGRLAVTVVDVAGHGPLAGLAALRLKYAMQSGLRGGGGARGAVDAAAHVMADEPERFATAAVVTLSPTGDLVWCNAGHPTPFVITARGDVERLAPTGPIISALGGAWTVGRGVLPVGGTLLLVSDGLLESRDDAGIQLSEAWSDADLAAEVNSAPDARTAAEQIAVAARARAAAWRADDVTVVAVRRP